MIITLKDNTVAGSSFSFDTVVGKIGEGRHVEAYLAQYSWPQGSKPVVVKMPKAASLAESRRIQRQADAPTGDGLPRVVAVIPAGKADGTEEDCIAVDYIRGITLTQFINGNLKPKFEDTYVNVQSLHNRYRARRDKIACQIVKGVAAAIRQMHNAGISHEELTADDVLITAEGGVALTGTGQARPNGQTRDDLYRIGVIACQLCIASCDLGHVDIGNVASAQMQDFIQKALGHGFGDIGELAATLDEMTTFDHRKGKRGLLGGKRKTAFTVDASRYGVFVPEAPPLPSPTGEGDDIPLLSPTSIEEDDMPLLSPSPIGERDDMPFLSPSPIGEGRGGAAKAEEARIKAEAERTKAEAERKAKQEAEEARVKAEAETKRIKAEQEAARKAAEAKAEEARIKAEAERAKAEAERAKAEAERKARQEAEKARLKAEAEKTKAEAEAKKAKEEAERQAKLKAQQEIERIKEEARRREEEAKRKEDEARRREEDIRRKAQKEREARLQAEAEAKKAKARNNGGESKDKHHDTKRRKMVVGGIAAAAVALLLVAVVAMMPSNSKPSDEAKAQTPTTEAREDRNSVPVANHVQPQANAHAGGTVITGDKASPVNAASGKKTVNATAIGKTTGESHVTAGKNASRQADNKQGSKKNKGGKTHKSTNKDQKARPQQPQDDETPKKGANYRMPL